MNTDNTTDNTPEPVTFQPPEWGGFPLPEGTTLAWGARAIYRLALVNKPVRGRNNGRPSRLVSSTYEADIDLVWDRMGWSTGAGHTGAEHKRMGAWLDKRAIPALRKACSKRCITQDTDEILEYASDSYKLVASPRASYGYLYITAWLVVS